MVSVGHAPNFLRGILVLPRHPVITGRKLNRRVFLVGERGHRIAHLKEGDADLVRSLEQVNMLVGQAVVVSSDFTVRQHNATRLAGQFLSVRGQRGNALDQHISLPEVNRISAFHGFVFHGLNQSMLQITDSEHEQDAEGDPDHQGNADEFPQIVSLPNFDRERVRVLVTVVFHV